MQFISSQKAPASLCTFFCRRRCSLVYKGSLLADGCSVSGVDAFFPNKKVYRLYSKLGYRERGIWMTERL
jgi:hypothetical protein